ncbi:MAG: hypothetical protein NW208_05630, partial [Bryobacter sp.]|nr:hypothetical protein [Bryobacter sp.]
MMNRRTALRGLLAAPALARTAGLKLSTFAVDVTPPLGAPLCFSLVEPVKSVAAPLWAKGVALYPESQLPIVLVAVDWLGIGGASYRDWQSKLAAALRTTPDRVAIHTVHQHDAPGSYRDAHARLAPLGLGAQLAPEAFCSAAVDRVAAALRAAPSQSVNAIGWGQARVEGIASNRRIVGPDGKFLFQRFTTCRNSEYCQAPDGVIDSYLRTVSFHGDKKRLATLHYYATHPMSLYGQGHVSGDFVGDAREALPGFHVYFTGA